MVAALKLTPCPSPLKKYYILTLILRSVRVVMVRCARPPLHQGVCSEVGVGGGGVHRSRVDDRCTAKVGVGCRDG